MVLEEAMSYNCDADHPMLNTQLLYNLQTPLNARRALCVTCIHAR